jgi:hypothetical protein
MLDDRFLRQFAALEFPAYLEGQRNAFRFSQPTRNL